MQFMHLNHLGENWSDLKNVHLRQTDQIFSIHMLLFLKFGAEQPEKIKVI